MGIIAGVIGAVIVIVIVILIMAIVIYKRRQHQGKGEQDGGNVVFAVYKSTHC